MTLLNKKQIFETCIMEKQGTEQYKFFKASKET